MGYAKQFQSTALAKVVYRSNGRELLVMFASGRAYRYSGVEESTAYGLISAESAGAYLNKNVVQAYPAAEISSAAFDLAYRAEENSGKKGFVLCFPGMNDASFLTWKKAA